jgi:hypothetical protein
MSTRSDAFIKAIGYIDQKVICISPIKYMDFKDYMHREFKNKIQYVEYLQTLYEQHMHLRFIVMDSMRDYRYEN